MNRLKFTLDECFSGPQIDCILDIGSEVMASVVMAIIMPQRRRPLRCAIMRAKIGSTFHIRRKHDCKPICRVNPRVQTETKMSRINDGVLS